MDYCDCPVCVLNHEQHEPLPAPEPVRLDRDAFGRLDDAPLQVWLDPWQDLGGEGGSA